MGWSAAPAALIAARAPDRPAGAAAPDRGAGLFRTPVAASEAARHLSSAKMYPYWILFSVSAFAALQYRYSFSASQSARGVLLLVGLAAVTAMLGLRMEIGGDWAAYIDHFKFYRDTDLFGSLTGHLDPGYGLLNWIVGQAGLPFVWVNLICGAIFCWGIFRFTQLEPSPWLALCIAVPYLIIVVGMGYTRQSVAIGFMLAGLASFQKNNSLLKLALYIAAGATFHKTIVVVFPIIALAQQRPFAVKAMILGGLAVLMYYAFAASSAESLYANYVVEEYDAAGAAIRLAMNAVPAAIFLKFRDRFQMTTLQSSLWRNFAWVSIALLLAVPVFSSSVFLDRLGLYFIPLQMVVIGRIPFTGRTAPYSARIALGIIAAYAVVMFAWFNTGVNAQWWLPYELYVGSDEQVVRLEQGLQDQ